MTSHNSVSSTVLKSAITSFQENKKLAERAIAQLPDEALHRSLDENTNSIVVIMKHIAGNLLSRWTDFLTTDGEKPWRNRDDEFVDSFTSRDELMDYWERGWSQLLDCLNSLAPEGMSQMITIRGHAHSVPLAIHRSLAHCAYHVGQIVIIARIQAGDSWETLTIPRGNSEEYNRQAWGRDG